MITTTETGEAFCINHMEQYEKYVQNGKSQLVIVCVWEESMFALCAQYLCQAYFFAYESVQINYLFYVHCVSGSLENCANKGNRKNAVARKKCNKRVVKFYSFMNNVSLA